MFERFTEAARLALFGDRLELTEAGGSAIEPEHLLMGLLEVNGGAAQRLAREAGMDAALVRQQVVPRRGPPFTTSVEVPFSVDATRVLTVGVREADAMSSAEVTTGHLLLGLLRDEATRVSNVLREHGLALNTVRRAVEAERDIPESCAPGAEDLFHERLRRVGLG